MQLSEYKEIRKKKTFKLTLVPQVSSVLKVPISMGNFPVN